MAKKYYFEALKQKNTFAYGHLHILSLYFDLGKLLLDTNPHESIGYIQEGLKDYPNEGRLWSLLSLSESHT